MGREGDDRGTPGDHPNLSGRPERARNPSGVSGARPLPWSAVTSIDPSTDGAPVTPEVLDAVSAPAVDGESEGDDSADGEKVSRPTKLIRIASMVRALLDEARLAPLDDAGRKALKEIHERSINELQGILSDDLRRELSDVTLPFSSEAPSAGELRIAQAQLVGWLEGLFHGIQATLFTQQMQAQQQFEEMRQRRTLEPGPGGRPPGNYL